MGITHRLMEVSLWASAFFPCCKSLHHFYSLWQSCCPPVVGDLVLSPVTAQSLHLGQPTCSLSLLSIRRPSAVAPVVTSQSRPLSRCSAAQMSALSQTGVLPLCFLFSPLAPDYPSLLSLHRSPLLFPLPASLSATECQDPWIVKVT